MEELEVAGQVALEVGGGIVDRFFSFAAGNGQASGGAGGTCRQTSPYTSQPEQYYCYGAGNPDFGTGGLIIVLCDEMLNYGEMNAKGSSSEGRRFGGSSGGGSINIFVKLCPVEGLVSASRRS